MDVANSKKTDWRRITFIFIAVMMILTLVLSACAPALDQPGAGKGGGNEDKGGGIDASDHAPVLEVLLPSTDGTKKPWLISKGLHRGIVQRLT